MDDPNARTECVLAFLGSAGQQGPEVLGKEICAALREGRDLQNASLVVATCMREWIGGELLGQLDAVQVACPRFETGDFIKYAMLTVLEDDPAVFDALRSELAAESLYRHDRTGMAVVLAAEIGLAIEDESLRDLLVTGATGAFGGTAAQMDLSALVVVRLIQDPDRIMAMVDAIVESPELPAAVANEAMGSTLMHILSIPRNLECQTESKMVSAIMSVLDHPLLGDSAALHILKQQQDPLPPISYETWQSVLTHAEMIRDL